MFDSVVKHVKDPISNEVENGNTEIVQLHLVNINDSFTGVVFINASDDRSS
jgi:predicted secreted protein